jgi:NAD(P)H-dependent flavin oxidoreductase YrpB (nitropropane dioxygenase family)
MGAGVSNWRLARRVAQLGEFGVVSGTGIDTILVRELQDGDPHDRRSVLREYPDPELVDYLIATFYREGGLPEGTPYKLLPIHGFKPTLRSQKILAAAAFTEVRLAKRGHHGLVGINLLSKLKRFSLASMYGAMLAGADAVLMGAGIPIEEAIELPKMARGEVGRLRIEVDSSAAGVENEDLIYECNPAELLANPPVLQPPAFYPIISSNLLAKILSKKLPRECVAGWIVELPIAGGHNAPPRGKQQDADENPIYDERDEVDYAEIVKLGYPFYLAGGFGSPQKLQEALALGASGVQVGSLFSLSDESGYAAEHKRTLIQGIHRGEISVRTDGRISPTGFPFKVIVGGELGVPEGGVPRKRICDLGYLQSAFRDEKGRLQGRCPAEPVDDYVRKGGTVDETVRRGCLCNGLMSNIGLPQQQKWGLEPQLFTAGDELVNLPLGSVDEPHYSAADVIDYLLGRPAGTTAAAAEDATEATKR